MDQKEILAQLRMQLPEDVLLDSGRDTLQFAIRSAFEFADFLAHVHDAADVTPDAERVAGRIAQALKTHYDMSGVASDSALAIDQDSAEELQYVNESIVAGGQLFWGLRHLASQIVRDTPPTPLRWRVYPSVMELKAEYAVHFDKLTAGDATAQERIVALLNAARLQMTFLANTFC